jgi:hypothetical protein
VPQHGVTARDPTGQKQQPQRARALSHPL